MIRRDDEPLLKFLRSQIELQRLHIDWISAVESIRSKVERQRTSVHALSTEILSSQGILEAIRDDIRAAKLEMREARHNLQNLRKTSHRTTLEIESATIAFERTKLERRRNELIRRRSHDTREDFEFQHDAHAVCDSSLITANPNEEVQQPEGDVIEYPYAQSCNHESRLSSLRQQNMQFRCQAVCAVELLKSLLQEFGAPEPESPTVETIPDIFNILKSKLLSLNAVLCRHLPCR